MLKFVGGKCCACIRHLKNKVKIVLEVKGCLWIDLLNGWIGSDLSYDSTQIDLLIRL